jgi:hypothetical protein
VYAVVTPNLTQRLIFMTLTALLAFALWQKARDQLPYLLDPDASPPPRVSLSDGLIAAMVFFVLQALFTLLALKLFRGGGITGAVLLLAFSMAGGLTYLLMRWVYAWAKTRDVPRLLSGGASQPSTGIVAGLAAGAFALLYLYVAEAAGWLENIVNERHACGAASVSGRRRWPAPRCSPSCTPRSPSFRCSRWASPPPGPTSAPAACSRPCWRTPHTTPAPSALSGCCCRGHRRHRRRNRPTSLSADPQVTVCS